MKRKTISLLLLISMLASFAVSCGSATDNTETKANTVDTTPTETEPADTSSHTALPEDLDFAGASYRIHNLTSTSYYDTIVAFE